MIGYGELIVILLLAMFLFGGKKLPELARNLGLGVREFKKALNTDVEVEPSSESKKVQESEDKPHA